MSALTIDSDRPRLRWSMLQLFNYHHLHLVSRCTRSRKACSFSGTMVKRKRNAVEGEGGSTPRSARVSKKAKLVEDVGITAVQIEKVGVKVSSTKSKRKVEASAQDVIDLSSFPERVSSEWKVGAHVSAAGGVENAVLNAAKIGANAFALFVKSQRKWSSPPLTESSISSFKSRMKELSYDSKFVLPHGSYLINLGNPDAEKREKSYECFLDDLRRCDALGLELYNFHPGSTLGIVDPSVSMTHIADCINRSHRDTPGSRVVTVLENMAGSGNIIGSDFAHLGEIISQVELKSRVGVCLDTCHMFAAGYDIRTKDGWNVTVESFDTHIGLEYLRGMHLNDSKTACGSKKDRHDNIGVGHLSIQTFAHILADPRMQNIPLILETPSHEGSNKNWDVWVKEIAVLNHLSSSSTLAASSSDEVSERMYFGSLTQGIKDTIKAAGTTGGGTASRGGNTVKRGRRKVYEEQEEESE
ncbi:AP endonuclease [Lentinula aciculospora]|uniref:Apurinic-apyrimidinic endonuclease 1 n=1 Tax=Lentinula aciculospora TaxID=153920 RepID=A0A9W9DTI8_9AGAR|nr:AP endonuclease [Lentinula aciculospora]